MAKIYILQKDITYYFKHREFSDIFTKNDHTSDNSVQMNIKFTFTVYEYIIYNNIYICKLCFLFIPTLLEHIHMLVTLVLYSHYLFKQVYLIIMTSRSSLPNCEHDSSYQ